ncbi:MAG TPA: hypothetical protein VE396_13875 [Xanthobacteraceae bacterium]|jgi:hypothetical protein|nr:hypothetical protein [Xanthobacteraceae bacterium]
MERLDHTRTVVAALMHLGDAGSDCAGLPRKVDALVDAYLVSFSISAKQTAAMRKLLADEFLAAAPFTELSYRIWRRIMQDDTDAPEPLLRVSSELLLPEVDFTSIARKPGALSQRVRPPDVPTTGAAKRGGGVAALVHASAAFLQQRISFLG